jgi:hypothetical protein
MHENAEMQKMRTAPLPVLEPSLTTIFQPALNFYQKLILTNGRRIFSLFFWAGLFPLREGNHFIFGLVRIRFF